MSSITTAISGKAGTLAGTAGTGDVGDEITEWTLDDTVGSEEATSMSSGGYFDSVEGIKKATGTFNAIGSSTPSKGTVTAVTLAVGVTTGQDQYVGDILITSVSVGVPVSGGVVAYSTSFEFRGSYVKSTVT